MPSRSSLVFGVLLLCRLLSARGTTEWFTAAESTEARLSFDAYVELTSSTVPSQDRALQAIEDQVEHLFGPMLQAPIKGAPKTDHTISRVKIEEYEDVKDLYAVSYRYSGTAQILNGSHKSLKIVLPINPATIYEDSFIEKDGRRYNPCTDEEYDGLEDFFYFWNPYAPDCQLEKDVHYLEVKGAFKRQANTTLSYPEYDRLPDADKSVWVGVFIGMDHIAQDRNPMLSTDSNAPNFLAARDLLLKRKFSESVWSDTDLKDIASKGELPYVVDFSRLIHGTELNVRVFFGPTQMGEPNQPFVSFLLESFESDAVTIYSGHSGLGWTLDIPSLSKAAGKAVKFNPGYQILFFNSCSSYPYYNAEYFNQKKSPRDKNGTKNLDILGFGMPTEMVSPKNPDTALLGAIVDFFETGSAKSYQDLAKEMDNGDLFGVNGDEDNPATPPTRK